MSIQWWHRHPSRMRQEVDTLRQHYPSVRCAIIQVSAPRCLNCESLAPDSPHLAVFADLHTFRGNRFPVAMIYPCNFPEHIPVVWFIQPLTPPPNVHYYTNGRPCLTANEHDSSVTGLIVLGWTYDWLKAYEIWRTTGRFPDGNFGKVHVR